MPQRPRSHEIETESNRAFEQALPARWVDRRLEPDYGLDYTVEIIDEDASTTPFSFHAQLKATDEPDLDKALQSLRFDREWAEHYWSLPIPVLIVRHHAPTGALFARWFHAYNPHIALRRETDSPTKTIGFRFTEADRWYPDTPQKLVEAVKAFMRFRSPTVELPLRFAVSSEEVDPLPLIFALRTLLAPVSDIVVVESAPPGPDRPHIVLGALSSTVALADVASVTLDYEADVGRDVDTAVADIATAVAMALIRVGQSNLAAQVARACSARSRAILSPDVAFPLAEAFYRARRVSDAVALAAEVGTRDEPEARFGSMFIETAAMARGNHLTSAEAEAAVELARERFERSHVGGDVGAAAADAYNLGQALRNRRMPEAAIDEYRRSASLDPTYEDRGYFNRELAGLLFESGAFEEAADRYRRAHEAEGDPFLLALKADALLWAGRYAEAQQAFDAYVRSGTRPRDAEWRLKHRAIALIQEEGGPQQHRDRDTAEALIAPVDFDSNHEMTVDQARAACADALRSDACCAEAWFRLALIVLVDTNGADTHTAFELSLVSAVLHRESPGAWNNTIRTARHADLGDELARDTLRMAYRFCGPSIAKTLSESDAALDSERDQELMSLLDDVMREVDDADRPGQFTIRIPAGDGEMTEFTFITETSADDVSTAHDSLPPADPSGGPS